MNPNNKKKFPIICPAGSRVEVTQGFMPITNPSHDAIDFVIQNPKLSQRENLRLTYGSQFVSPVTGAKCVLINDFGTFNEKGNGVDIEWEEDGYFWRLHFWHNESNSIKLGDVVTNGQIVGYMGNTGFVNPIPTPLAPYGGTHCHLRLSRSNRNQWGGNYNITSLDPRDYFDVTNPYSGADSSIMIDLEPVKWAWLKLGIVDNAKRLPYMLKYIFG